VLDFRRTNRAAKPEYMKAISNVNSLSMPQNAMTKEKPNAKRAKQIKAPKPRLPRGLQDIDSQ